MAEILFYLIYHLEIPLVCRISLRILNSLKIVLNREIKTPIEKTYKTIMFTDKGQEVKEFKFEKDADYNNPELIGTKCFEAFKDGLKN